MKQTVGEGGTHMKPVFWRPCLSASWLEVLIFLLRILLAHLLRQSASLLPAMVVIRPLTIARGLSDSVPESWPASELLVLAAGLDGRGEKVPW